MLRLLRSVRRSLMTGNADSKLRSYFLYAVGEITLVVVGILIALQIGEWAEDREREAQARAILVEIREDLIGDAWELSNIVPRRYQADSVRDYVLRGEATRSDFERRPYGALYYLPINFVGFEPRRTGWERLLRFEGEFPPGFAELRSTLDELFVQTHAGFQRESRIEQEQSLAREQWLVDNTDWAWRFDRMNDEEDPLPPEIIDWFYSGHQYRNWMGQMLGTGGRFDDLYGLTVAAWAAIGWEIGASVEHPMIPAGVAVDDPAEVAPLLGRWLGPEAWGGVEFLLRSGVIYMRRGSSFWPYFRSGPNSWEPIYQNPDQRSTWRLEVDQDGETLLVREPPPAGTGELVIFRKGEA